MTNSLFVQAQLSWAQLFWPQRFRAQLLRTWWVWASVSLAGLSSAWVHPAAAGVTRIEILQRLPYAEGRSFATIGPYERFLGRVHFAVDPAAPANQAVVDLDLAPRNSQERVAFIADLEILAPVDLTQSNGTLLYDVNNRGNRVALGTFNTGGDHFLMRQGYILVWSGWIAEVLPGGERLRLDAPVATEQGRAIRGLVRAEMAPDTRVERMTITYGASNGSYEPTAAGIEQATLTWRLRERDERVLIPREQWRLDTIWNEQSGPSPLPLVECVLAGGFQPGYLYELIYEAQNPVVQGLGLAGIRDLVSHLKYDRTEQNPLLLTSGGSAAERAIGFGVSQSGRCLRMFLYDGFNADEQQRIVFDGLMPHVAGAGLGFFNHRFAAPTRHNTQHDNHLFPTDVFPFTYGDAYDSFTGRTDGLLRQARALHVVPKIMHTQTSAEYWTRAGSLVHTDPLGTRDAELPPEVRLYSIGGAQHGPGNGIPAERTTGTLPHNPTDFRPLLRALLTALNDWIRDGSEPPPSCYPRIDGGTLASWRASECGWSAIPAVRYPEVIHQPEFRDFGPEFLTHRRISLHPPAIRGEYRVLVPRNGPDNNELGMLLPPSVSVPVATFTGWNHRHPSIGAETELLSLAGGYIPFPKTAAEREAQGDPRRSVQERYASFEDYLSRYTEAARQLIADRYLLAEDLPMLIEQAHQHRPFFLSP